MARNDIKVIKNPGGTRVYDAEDTTSATRGVSLKPGEMVKIGGTALHFVVLMESGEPDIGTDEIVGIVKKESTETATADGEVEVTTLLPMATLLRVKAHTVGNIDTALELQNIMYDWVVLECGTGVQGSATYLQKIDENIDNYPTSAGIQIITGDIVNGTLDVIVSAQATSAAQYL